jgi:hypothetical protein
MPSPFVGRPNYVTESECRTVQLTFFTSRQRRPISRLRLNKGPFFLDRGKAVRFREAYKKDVARAFATKNARGCDMTEATAGERPVTCFSLMLKTRAMISQSRAQCEAATQCLQERFNAACVVPLGYWLSARSRAIPTRAASVCLHPPAYIPIML